MSSDSTTPIEEPEDVTPEDTTPEEPRLAAELIAPPDTSELEEFHGLVADVIINNWDLLKSRLVSPNHIYAPRALWKLTSAHPDDLATGAQWHTAGEMAFVRDLVVRAKYARVEVYALDVETKGYRVVGPRADYLFQGVLRWLRDANAFAGIDLKRYVNRGLAASNEAGEITSPLADQIEKARRELAEALRLAEENGVAAEEVRLAIDLPGAD